MRLEESDSTSVRQIEPGTGNVGRDRRGSLVVLALILVTVALYFPARHFDFVYYDDQGYVAENPMVLRGLTWPGFRWAFTTGWEANWHPLTWLSHMLDCELFGPNPGAMHCVNLLFHTLSSVLLFFTLRRLTGTLWRSAFVAALFAWHPLQVQSVAWVAERKNVLSMFFWVLTVWQYARHVERPTRSGYGLLLLFFALGLLSKPMVVTLPFVLLLLDFWPLNRWPPDAFRSPRACFATARRLAWEKWPLFLLTVASCVVTFLVQRAGGAVSKLEYFPLGERFHNAFVSYLWYVEKTFWPVDLCVFYPLQPWPGWLVGAAILALIATSAVAFWQARRRPWWFTGWFFFLGTMVPAIGIVQVGSQARADRYMYLPVIGLFILAVWSVNLPARFPRGRVIAAGLAGLVLCSTLLNTAVQLPYWRDSPSLLNRAIAVTRNNVMAHNALGYYLWSRGRPAEAQPHLAEALRINPQYLLAVNGMGHVLIAQDRNEEAMQYSLAALKLNPASAEAHLNLAWSLARLGRTNEALRQCQKVLQLEPENPKAMHNLGLTFAALNLHEQAARCHRKEAELDPSSPEAHYLLGEALSRLGRKDEAAACYVRASQLPQADAVAQVQFGIRLADLGKLESALDCYRRALARQPDHAAAHYHLANALMRSGRREEALPHYTMAVRTKPDFLPARQNFGIALGDLGRFDQALLQFKAALHIKPDYPEAHAACGYAMVRTERFAEAAAHYTEALRLRPDWVAVLERWARLRATHPSDQLRNGPEAVQLAERACKATQQPSAALLDTLAAAYAEAGRFTDAVATVRQALQAGGADRGTQLEARLRLYESGRPYRESP